MTTKTPCKPSDTVKVCCPGCWKTYSVPRKLVGHMAQCKRCMFRFIVSAMS